jgi:hypothetical protein
MMPHPSEVSVVLVGAGGYGNIYLASLFNASHLNETGVGLRLIAAVDPNPSSCRFLDELKRRQVPIYSTMEEIYARFHDGRVKNYGSPDRDPHRKLWVTAASVRSGQPTACGIEAAMAQTMVMAAVHEGVPEAVDFPPALVRTSGNRGRQKRWVEGLDRVLINAYEQGRLPNELGIPWAVAGETISVSNLPQINPLTVCLRGMSRVHMPALTTVAPQVVAETIVSP